MPEEAPGLVSGQKAAGQRRDKVYRLHLRGYTDLDVSKELQLDYSVVKRDLKAMSKRKAEWYRRYKAGDPSIGDEFVQWQSDQIKLLTEELRKLRKEKPLLVKKR